MILTFFNVRQLVLILLILGCSKSQNKIIVDPDPVPIAKTITIIEAFPNLSFEHPVDFQTANDGTNRLFVVEQSGLIYTFANDQQVTKKTLFLDIKSLVDDSGNEEGLLGLAFHPNYAQNGYFYVNFTNNQNKTVIARFQAQPSTSNIVNINSMVSVLEFEQPFTNHNGGQLVFGPDGFLYIAAGDGGGGGDSNGNGQNLNTLLGKILRIDVNQTKGNLNYGIPTDNPFINNPNSRGEIYAYGFRNPWRMSFDSAIGELWVADVGEQDYEEVDKVTLGANYGWNTMEGLHCFDASSCDTSNLTLPVYEYNHANGDHSITGGFVYRGLKIPNLQGLYVFADFVSGRIWTLNASSFESKVLFDTEINISSFGIDANKELYFCGFDGKIYTFGLE